METRFRGRKAKFTVNWLILLALMISAGEMDQAFAQDNFYVGNPTRPHTIWVPGRCNSGCWVGGRYFKILNPTADTNLTWVGAGYDSNGNWVPAHWQLHNYVVINPGRDSDYVGWAM